MISEVEIKNFRSIKHLNIKTESLCGLIGPNSTGKTNVLKALNIILGDIYPTERAFTRDDFHRRDTSKEIQITVRFSAPLEAEKLSVFRSSTKDWCECVSMTLTYALGEGGASTTFTCIGKCGQHFYCNGAVREKVCFIYVPSERTLEKQLSVSKWTLLGKMLAKVDACFRKDEALVSEFESAMKAPQEILERDFDSSLSYFKFKEVLLQRVANNTQGHADGCELNLEIFDPLWFYKAIQITTMEGGERYNVDEIGSGMQNLILLSLFQAYADLMKDKAVLAIEEPELFLFPQAQRELFREFFSIAKQGGQVFYTTHSPRFVNVAKSENIVLLRKKEGETIKLNRGDIDLFLSENDKNEIHLLTKFDAEVNELFFANKILLVEGYTEKTAIKRVLNKLDPSLRKYNYCVVNATSKTFIPFFIKLLKCLGHADYLAVYDTDLAPGKLQPALDMAQKHTQKILDEVEDSELNCFAFNYDFESHCGYTVPNDGEKLMEAIKWTESVAIESIPADFKKMLDFIRDEGDYAKHTGVEGIEIIITEETLADNSCDALAPLILTADESEEL
jgi:putative ATP-dependent endonuclease of OLD family